MFEKARERYKNDEKKYLVGNVIDKYEFCKTRNKITHTDFLDESQVFWIEKILKEEKISNYVFYGILPEADRKLLIFYPDKIDSTMLEKNYTSIFDIIKIDLPAGMHYEHREYLSGIMKLGIKREKFGDISVLDGGAEIICEKEISKILVDGLRDLTRFKKSEISIMNIEDVSLNEKSYEEVSIIIPSNRLDNFVAEISRTSRNKASEYISEGRVFVNYENEYKDSKKINTGDVITVRGKGKFIFDRVERNTGSQNMVVILKKYV